MLHPIADKIQADRLAGVGRVIADDRLAVGCVAIATALRLIDLLLLGVFGVSEAAADRAALGRPTNQRNGQDRLDAGLLPLLYKYIRRGAIRQRSDIGVLIRYIFEEPVAGTVRGIVLPIVACGRVAAP